MANSANAFRPTVTPIASGVPTKVLGDGNTNMLGRVSIVIRNEGPNNIRVGDSGCVSTGFLLKPDEALSGDLDESTPLLYAAGIGGASQVSVFEIGVLE